MRLLYYYIRIKEYTCERLHVVRFYTTSLGLKNINASQLLFNSFKGNHELVKIPPSKLYLGPDFLRDKYTLLDCPVSESPHIGLMAALMKGEPIEKTDYIKRFLKGTLDWRSALIMPKDKTRFQKKYECSLAEIQSGEYPPAVVYLQGGRYYIYDGKHRAALCALLGKEVRCKVVGNEIANANVWNYMFQMVDGKTEFQLHTEFHKSFLTEHEKKCR